MEQRTSHWGCKFCQWCLWPRAGRSIILVPTPRWIWITVAVMVLCVISLATLLWASMHPAFKALQLFAGRMFCRRFRIHRDGANLTTLVINYSNAALRIILGLVERNAYGKHGRPDDGGEIVVANKSWLIKEPVAVCNIEKVAGHWLRSGRAVDREASRLSWLMSWDRLGRLRADECSCKPVIRRSECQSLMGRALSGRALSWLRVSDRAVVSVETWCFALYQAASVTGLSVTDRCRDGRWWPRLQPFEVPPLFCFAHFWKVNCTGNLMPRWNAGRAGRADMRRPLTWSSWQRRARPRRIGGCILMMMIGGERLEKASAQVQAVGHQD